MCSITALSLIILFLIVGFVLGLLFGRMTKQRKSTQIKNTKYLY